MKRARSLFAGFGVSVFERNRVTPEKEQKTDGKQYQCCQQRMNGLYMSKSG